MGGGAEKKGWDTEKIKYKKHQNMEYDDENPHET